MASLTCMVLTTDSEIEALEPEWRALQARIGTTSFTDYDWFHIWWRTVGKKEDRTLHVVTARRDGALVGVLPLAVLRWRGFRMLQYAGAEAFYHGDMLAATEEEAAALWQASRKSPHYDFAHLRDTYPGSLCEKTLENFATLHDRNKGLYLTLDWESGDAWRASLSKQFRRNLDKATKRLAEQGEIRYQLCESLPLTEGVIEGMVHHKTIWCQEHGLEGMFDQQGILAYYRQMAEHAAKDGSLLLGSLHCGDTPIAFHLMYRREAMIYSYTLGTDAAWLKYSPGHLAHVNAIAWAIDNGFKLFYHMQGDFAYKYQFSNGEWQCREYTFHRNLKGWLGKTLLLKRREMKRKKLSAEKHPD